MARYWHVTLATRAVGEAREFDQSPPDTSRKGFVWMPETIQNVAYGQPAGPVSPVAEGAQAVSVRVPAGPPARYVDPADLIALLTAAEMRAIESFVASNDAALVFWRRFQVRVRRIDLLDPDFPAARSLFKSIIGDPRASEILAAWAATATVGR